MIAAAVHPPSQRDGLAGLRAAQFTAGVSLVHGFSSNKINRPSQNASGDGRTGLWFTNLAARILLPDAGKRYWRWHRRQKKRGRRIA
jgi:hypothetical protein